ncbi:MAG: NUDIX hydrolase [Candidatus Eremiobacteraeota bacterium]|nr:NUDIX hydrolase [Candidatus Eremiobacteraeota bacterium]MCW5868735.1 NUDIX hydrolase [Candidatus Eremiobacteraeota bacterium]
MQPWEFLESESRRDYGIFFTRIDQLKSPRTGHVLRRVVVEAPDWVNVVARTVDGQYVLVRQIRHGIGAPSLEIPAGMVEPGEDPALAAARELVEETGYEPESIRLLGQVYPNPAFQSNTCFIYLADGCRRVREVSLDDGEEIAVELWSWPALLAAVRSGEIQHALMIAALFYLCDQSEVD